MGSRSSSRWKRRQLKLLTAPWRGPLSALAAVIGAGAAGYRITEGWDWGDALWMVLITISTIGYGEVAPLTPAGRLVTVLIVGGGLIVVQLTKKPVRKSCRSSSTKRSGDGSSMRYLTRSRPR